MTGDRLTVLREAIQAADAYDCGCDDPGNEARCINTERFAALADVEALIEAARQFEADLSEWCDGSPRDALRAVLARFPATSPAKEQA